MPFQYTFRADDISTWDVDTRDLVENRDRELELYSTTIDTSFLNLNASNLTSGTVPSARMTGAYTGITSVGTLGSLTVTGDLTVDTNTLKVDSTNNRVGIANASPAYTLDVNGTVEATQFLQGTDYLSPYQGFRNRIINGDFRINQRGFTSSTTSALYGFDRWVVSHVGGTCTQSVQTFTVGSPAAIGYESANYLQFVTASQSAASNFAKVRQFVEDVRTFANSTVTVSFWAKATSGTPKVAIELNQGFGSGGSPSAEVNVYGGQVTLSTSWARYSLTVAVPNISGKTIGTTANTSSLSIDFWTSAGSTYNARSGSLGIQNNTFHFWGVQVERGAIATPFEQRPIGTELALCQRYYEKGAYSQKEVNLDTLRSKYAPVQYKVNKRVTPTSVSNTNTGTLNVNFATFTASTDEYAFIVWQSTNSFDYVCTVNWTASAEL